MGDRHLRDDMPGESVSGSDGGMIFRILLPFWSVACFLGEVVNKDRERGRAVRVVGEYSGHHQEIPFGADGGISAVWPAGGVAGHAGGELGVSRAAPCPLRK